jgi:4-azaleucine resistance transporter AzlC
MSNLKKDLKAAFPYTIPVLTGYIVLGAAYGILINSKGYSLLWIILTSMFIYAGSMQFVSVSLLSLGFNPIYTFLITLMVNARHLFYGISMLSKYNGTGEIKPYLIFGLTDETFSILCSTEPPEGINKKRFMFLITLMNQIYWIVGSIIGGVLGSLIKFNTKGIDFVLTSLFVVIFINQWKSTKNHIPVIIGVGASILCRILFGATNFIIPSMIAILLCVTILQKQIEARNKTCNLH